MELPTPVLLAKAKENCEPLEARKGQKDSSLEPSEGVNTLTLDLWPSQLLRKQIFVILSHQVFGNLLNQT